MVTIDERRALVHPQHEPHVEDERWRPEPDPIRIDPCVDQFDQLRLKEVQLVDALARRYPALRIIGVSSNEPDDIRQYALDHHVAYTLASDPGDNVSTSYWHAALVVIDKAGIVRHVQGKAGDTSQLDAVIDKLLR